MPPKCIHLALGAALAAASIPVVPEHGLAQSGLAQSQDGVKTPVPKAVPDPPLPAPKRTIPEKIVPCHDDGDLDVTEFDRCNGVITPKPGVDPEIEASPPEPSGGTTPVIPPRVLEQQEPETQQKPSN